uniref:Uncharacterized protein n=1 Tax=Porphyridium purpureum TaxID=35688 RepID=W0RYY3_PORPP|nr:hypothetical protein Y721_p156 [Porphyridium purpureum]BAO23652.1 hypothetical protein [Porphyridium purpureum]
MVFFYKKTIINIKYILWTININKIMLIADDLDKL